jgi:hypothetical protein
VGLLVGVATCVVAGGVLQSTWTLASHAASSTTAVQNRTRPAPNIAQNAGAGTASSRVAA